MRALESILSPWIHLAGNCSRGPWQALHRRMPHYMLVVSYEGDEQVTIDGQKYEVKSGGGYLVQPGALLDHFGSEKGNRPAFLHFDLVYSPNRQQYENTPDFATDLNGRSHLLQPTTLELFGVDLPVQVPVTMERVVAREVDSIVEDWYHGGQLGQLRANAALMTLMLDWVRAHSKTSGEAISSLGIEERLRRAEALARTSLERGFNSEDFARHAGFSRTHFSRIYRAHRGQSPGEALRDMRLSSAERLLRETRLSVVDIARLVGFPNASTLARSFRQRYGKSPSSWRTEPAGESFERDR